MASKELLDAATDALERLRARSGESADEWAERLAPTFFADLDRMAVLGEPLGTVPPYPPFKPHITVKRPNSMSLKETIKQLREMAEHMEHRTQ